MASDDSDNPDRKHVYLPPGALCCLAEPGIVTTVLGSCVAVCLWDKQSGVAGINHFILPESDNETPCLRYGNFAIARLVAAMLELGADFETISAKIFGGAAVLPQSIEAAAGGKHVGTHNVDFAMARLVELGIPIIARRTGGNVGMNVQLFTETGEVRVRTIRSQNSG
ncbi:MAG: chemotaxis protein CheD [Alphaproteobacteria bacterium]